MAADSKPFIRGREPNNFKGCLGVCLGFTNPDAFKNQYNEYIDKICKHYGFQRQRKVLKTFDFNKLFEDDRAEFISCMGSFVSMLAKNDVHINAVFTTLNTKLLSDGIKKYGVEKYPTEKKDALKFIDELNNYYPYVATWKVSKKAFLRGTNINLDSFTGEYTKAWGELCAHHKINVVPKGDFCNPFISSADLVVGYIDEYLSQNRLRLEESSIKSSLDDCEATESHVFYVGHPDLNEIVPIKKQINLAEHYKRPMIYILKEEIIKGQSESKFIESSLLWNKLLNFAYDKNSGIKFISYTEDHKNIRNGDYLIYLGDKGKEFICFLESLGYDINAVSSKNILRNS